MILLCSAAEYRDTFMTHTLFTYFSREDLRRMARIFSLPLGRDKIDTARSIAQHINRRTHEIQEDRNRMGQTRSVRPGSRAGYPKRFSKSIRKPLRDLRVPVGQRLRRTVSL